MTPVTGGGGARVVLHHDLGRAALLLVVVVGGAVVVAGPDGGRARLLGLLGAVAAVAALGWRPAVVVDDEALTLVNPLRTVRLPWSAVQDVTMGWVLTVTADGVRHRAWAVPGPGSMAAPYERRWTEESTLERLAPAAVDRAGGAGLGAVGLGAASTVVAQRWAQRRDLPVPDGAPGVRVHVSPAGAALLLTAALAATAALALTS